MNLYTDQLKQYITKELINAKFDPDARNSTEVLFSNKQLLFEQYKLLIDSAHKIEERRSGSNNIFLGVNTLLSSFIARPYQLFNIEWHEIPMLILLSLIGIFICLDWIKVTESYKILNYINFSLIKELEESFPSKIFSLRAELEQIKFNNPKDKEQNKANIILINENILQKLFSCFYMVYIFILSFRAFTIFTGSN